jgi:hypothetical protein
MIIGWLLASGMAVAAQGATPDFDLRCVTINSADVVRVQVTDGRGRIRYPLTRNLGAVGRTPKYGWFLLSALSVEPDQITGRFKLGWLQTPRVRVDRTTGAMEVSGSDGVRFSGMCEPYPAAAPERLF